ncbi:MAG: hypothetical protein AAB706_03515, partial [Patescibacteria group bacterium]
LGAIGAVYKPTVAKEPKKQTAAEQKASVLVSVNSYLQNKNSQAEISPEDLYDLLIDKFPEAFDYITTKWTPKKIRIANGEKNPYGEKK